MLQKSHKTFSCLAECCPQHCCVAWKIAVDQETIDRWKTLPDSIYQELLKSTAWEQGPAGGYRMLRKKENGDCIRLDNSGLCTIELEHGAAMQPSGCRRYPRKYYQIADTIIKTAELSCPEVARLVVNNDSAKVFDAGIYFSKSEILQLQDKEQVCYALYRFMMRALGCKAGSLSVKICLIAQTTGKLLDRLEEEGFQPMSFKSVFSKVLSSPEKKLATLAHQYSSNQVRVRRDRLSLYWQAITIIIKRRAMEFRGVKLYDSGIWHTLNKTPELLTTKFQSRLPLGTRIKVNPMLESALANYVYTIYLSHGFPLNPCHDNLLLSLAHCNIIFSITSLLLNAIQETRDVEIEDVANIIWQVDRISGNSDDLYQFIAANDVLLIPELYSASPGYLFG